MEHPGLVALGQPLMLLPPGVESLARQQRGASITIHELAHYWYGDLVTLAWWDDTWLNESFGSWIEGKVTDRLDPAWRWHRRSIGARLQAMEADALPGAKRIRQPVRSREDIETSFDAALTYSKGRTVLAMFERVGRRGRVAERARQLSPQVLRPERHLGGPLRLARRVARSERLGAARAASSTSRGSRSYARRSAAQGARRRSSS